MIGLLIVVFIVVPVIELYVFVQVSAAIGFLPSLLLVVTFSVAGAWLVKREGIGVARRAQAQLDNGQLPAAEIVNGLLLLLAGALMLFPGYVTDLLGLILLIPPARAGIRVLLLRRFEKRVRAAFANPSAAMFGGGGDGGFGPAADIGFRSARVHTGEATYGSDTVYDVHEVDPDRSGSDRSGSDDPGSDDPGAGRPVRDDTEPPALGRY